MSCTGGWDETHERTAEENVGEDSTFRGMNDQNTKLYILSNVFKGKSS